MSSRRRVITERLTAAAQEIFSVFEQNIVEYEEEVNRQRKLLEIVCQPRVKLQRTELPQQHVCKDEEVLHEQQLWHQEKNSSLNQEEPESGQKKEEQEEICTSHEGERLELKSSRRYLRHLITEQLTAAAVQMFSAFERTIAEYKEEVNRQRKLLEIVCQPQVKLQRTELPQQHVCKEEEVLTEQQLWNQEKNSTLDQEEPESRQIKEEQEEICTSHEGKRTELKQEADTLMLTAANEKSDHIEPEPGSDHQLLSHSSPVAESQGHTGSNHSDSLSNRNAKANPQKRSYRKKVNCNTPKKGKTDKKTFKCDTCGKMFLLKHLLKDHVTIHTGEKPYTCKTCGTSFRQRSTLIGHVRIHTGEKPYSCKTCGKSFRRREIMTRHEKIHTDEKPYSCKTCGNSFRQQSALICHVRIHTGEKPYSCKTCGKAFSLNQCLTVHEKVHSDEKPFSCKTCRRCFRHRSAWVRHMKIHR